jgi:transcriptional regulator with XRE-family HTH domain
MARDTASKRPTLKDLAREAGVSLTSASYAVNGNGSVGEQTRAHILEVARQIGYRLNVAARAMKTGRSGTPSFPTSLRRCSAVQGIMAMACSWSIPKDRSRWKPPPWRW